MDSHYSPRGWTKILGVGGEYDIDAGFSENLKSSAMALVPACLAVLGVILAFIVLCRLCCCGPKAGDHTRRGRSCWPSLCWAGLSFGLVAVGVIIFLATARHGVSITDQLVQDATGDSQSAEGISLSLNTTGNLLLQDLDALPQKCENDQFKQAIADQVAPLRAEVAVYVKQVDSVAGTLGPITDQLTKLQHGDLRDYEGIALGLAAIPIILITLACLVMIASVLGTAMCCRPGSCCANLEDFLVFKVGAVVLALTILVVAIVSAVQLLFGVALADACQDPDQFVLNLTDKLAGPNSTWYHSHGDMEYRMARYYISAEGSNPIGQLIDGAKDNLTKAQDDLNSALSFAAPMAAACGTAWKADVDRLSASINGNITDAQQQLDQCSSLFSLDNVYPYYKQAVHVETCNVVIDGLAWLSLFQFLVGLVALPCLSCRAASFVHRRAVEKREKEEQQAALLEQGSAPGHRVLS
jgi:hypothetical protein